MWDSEPGMGFEDSEKSEKGTQWDKNFSWRLQSSLLHLSPWKDCNEPTWRHFTGTYVCRQWDGFLLIPEFHYSHCILCIAWLVGLTTWNPSAYTHCVFLVYRDPWGLLLGNNEFHLNFVSMWANSNKKKTTGNIVFTVKEQYSILWLWLYHLAFSSVPSLLCNCVTIFPLRHRAIISMNISISEVHQ